jgi:hypothetical protein
VLDPEAFLTELYVLVDEFATANLPPEGGPGPAPALSRSEVVALAVFGQWARFSSERDFWRYAAARLRPLFPRLPDRGRFNRALRRHRAAAAAFALWLARALGAAEAAYEALDATAVPVRNAKRRGRGWLAGLADKALGGRVGWYRGFYVLLAVDPAGAVTGWGVGPASANDRALAEAFFALRAAPDPRLPTPGRAAGNVYVADAGFAGEACEAGWLARYGAQTVCPPQANAARAAGWSAADRRWLASARQVVEAVIGRLHGAFRLDRERPHALDGFQARLAAKVGLHNFCCWLNRKLGRPDLAVADLLGW